MAEVTSFVVGTPIKILIIVTSALVLNVIVRRLIRRSMQKLGAATAEHGDAVVSDRSVERAEERAARGE